LFRLYCTWRGLDVDYERLGVRGYGPFSPVFEQWHAASAMEQATMGLCRLHGFKAVNFDLPDDDFVFGLQQGPFSEFPVEVLFLQRVRRDLGLPVPNPEHPLLRSPLMRIPFPCPRSGYDPDLDWIYSKCKEQIPHCTFPGKRRLEKQEDRSRRGAN